MPTLHGKATDGWGRDCYYDVTWDVGPPITWTSSVTHDGHIVSQPRGTISDRSGLSELTAVQLAIEASIKACADMTWPES